MKNKSLAETRYKNALSLIRGIGYDYDGYDTTNGSQMQNLVDELIDIATLALYPEMAREPIERAMLNDLEGNYKGNRQYEQEVDHILIVSLANRKKSIHKE